MVQNTPLSPIPSSESVNAAATAVPNVQDQLDSIQASAQENRTQTQTQFTEIRQILHQITARLPLLAPSPDIPSSSRANFNIPHPFHPPSPYPEYKPYRTELEMGPRDSRTFYSNMEISDAEEEEEKKDEDGKVEEVDAKKEKDTNRPLLLGKFEMQCTRLTGGLKEEAIQAKISDEGKLSFRAYEVFDKISIRSYKIQKMRKLELSQAKQLVQTLEVCTATRFGSLGLVDSITNSGLCQVHYALSSSSVEPVNISVRNHKIKHKKKRILSPKMWMFKYKKEESED